MSEQPEFLSIDDVLRIYHDQMVRYGGAIGIRDVGMLISAVETPPATFDAHFLHEDIFSMAAAYLFHLVQNHPFVDGNKRVGAASALVFLDLNGIDTQIQDDDLFDLVMRTARGACTKGEIAAFLRECK